MAAMVSRVSLADMRVQGLMRVLLDDGSNKSKVLKVDPVAHWGDVKRLSAEKFEIPATDVNQYYLCDAAGTELNETHQCSAQDGIRMRKRGTMSLIRIQLEVGDPRTKVFKAQRVAELKLAAMEKFELPPADITEYYLCDATGREFCDDDNLLGQNIPDSTIRMRKRGVAPQAPPVKIPDMVKGQLLKKVAVKWAPRYFELNFRDGLLFQWENQTSEPKQYDLVTKYSRAEQKPGTKQVWAFQLVPVGSNKEFLFAAQSELEMKKWIDGFNRVFGAKDVKSPTTSKPTRTDLRIERRIYVRVGEAKNLRSMDVGGASDPYCIINFGEGVVERTPTVWNEINPFWGEEYTKDVDKTFQTLRVTVWDDSKVGTPRVIGKVEMSKKACHRGEEQWYPLQGEGDEDLVQGDVHLQLRLEHAEAGSRMSKSRLFVKLIEAMDLAPKDSNGRSDPYIKLHVGDSHKKSTVKRMTLSPKWHESFVFEVDAARPEPLRIVMFDWDRLSRNDFMGEFEVLWDALEPNVVHDGWYRLHSHFKSSPAVRAVMPTEGEIDINDLDALEDEEAPEGKEALGSIRLKVLYTEDYILPLEANVDFLDLLMDPSLIAVEAIGAVTAEREKVAHSLVRVFESYQKAVDLLMTLNDREIMATPSVGVLFRGNSLATKANDCYQRLLTKEYLSDVLKPIVDEIFSSELPCEVDPTRIDKTAHLESHWHNLKALMGRVVERIFSSVDQCPLQLRRVYHHLQTTAIKKFPENADTVRYTSVSGFLFLRLFCAALLGPKLFDLSDKHPNEVKSRTFTLCSKTLQNLANLATFGRKEPFMDPMNEFINSNMDSMKKYIDAIASVPGGAEDYPVPPIDTEAELACLRAQYHKDMKLILKADEGKQVEEIEQLRRIIENLTSLTQHRLKGSKYEHLTVTRLRSSSSLWGTPPGTPSSIGGTPAGSHNNSESNIAAIAGGGEGPASAAGADLSQSEPAIALTVEETDSPRGEATHEHEHEEARVSASAAGADLAHAEAPQDSIERILYEDRARGMTRDQLLANALRPVVEATLAKDIRVLQDSLPRVLKVGKLIIEDADGLKIPSDTMRLAALAMAQTGRQIAVHPSQVILWSELEGRIKSLTSAAKGTLMRMDMREEAIRKAAAAAAAPAPAPTPGPA